MRVVLAKRWKEISTFWFQQPTAVRWMSTRKRQRNPYDVLKVSKDASTEDIKKAFFEMAHKLHPDKNPSPGAREAFAEAKTAYELLGDPDKRRIYDAYAPAAEATSSGRKEETDTRRERRGKTFEEEVWSEFESFVGSRQAKKAPKKGADIVIDLGLSFLEAVNGGKRNLRVKRKAKCTSCSGSGCQPSTSAVRCFVCSGRGSVHQRIGIEVVVLPCKKCQGKGSTIPYPCKDCKGTTLVDSESSESIDIPPGVHDGQTLRMRGKGSMSESGGPAGDLMVKLKVEVDEEFRRDEFDVHSDVSVSISTAALGGRIKVKTVCGVVEVEVPSGSADGDRLRIPNKGISKVTATTTAQHRGYHIAHLRLLVPRSLTEAQRRLFEQLSSLETSV
eukprot:TRINITY_DN6254_c0_g2_i2.p1 TRINITY_DN6254_c0_g2~~TRINITY_DN6254_c0_g2_i2.p1  ORF type:complete len:389 (+),score=70.23 TRINITY_DN6254_c0_g2_i2:83-1249(+)